MTNLTITFDPHLGQNGRHVVRLKGKEIGSYFVSKVDAINWINRNFK